MGEQKKNSSTGAIGAGMAAGGFLGAKIGIAGFFGAISGAVPLALLGGYVGHRLYKAAKDAHDNSVSQKPGEEDAAKIYAAAVSEGYQDGLAAARQAERLRALRLKLPAPPAPPPRRKN